ncbi:S-layer homology domain-containing protein [Paenibacillus sp. P36]|uniref:S-layer homology domain-containing protein n=1 Tax=Paenibacillus sp. P36 TaxID=3342538 RepID=UPI0038B3DEAE
MKALKKALWRIGMSSLLLVNLISPALPATTAFAAISGSNSVENPPQSIVEKTDIATWNYTSAAQVTAAAPSFAATSGYYSNPSSTLQLFKSNAQVTSGLSYASGGISNTNFSGQMDKGYWIIKTSTVGFKDLIFNYGTRSSGTGPRDLNTEWSTDGTSWTVFGNKVADTGYTVKIESTSPLEQFGMTLPAEAANQNTLYIRIIQKSDASEGNGTIGTGGTYTVNGLQLYGAKDPAYTTPAVTASPDATGAILDVTPITLANTDTNAQIFYTTDGTTPATTVGGSTKLYNTPITALSEGGFTGTDPFVVKAVAKSPTLMPSDVATLSFNQQTITLNADAKKLDAGKYVWVKGIGMYLDGNTTLYIQDGMNAGSGLVIYKSGADFSSYVGKEIYVYGKASPYNGLMEIVPDAVNASNIVVRNSNPTTLPTPTKIMFSQLADRTYEGMLVSVDTVKLDSVTGTGTSYYDHTVSQAGITAKLRAKAITLAAGSYVNITKAVAKYNNGVQLLSTNVADLVAVPAPTVEFMTSSVPTGTTIPLNSRVTLTTPTTVAQITYSLNGGAPVTSVTNSVYITVDAFQNGTATITASASDGSYTTSTQTFTYTQSQVAKVLASPGSSAIDPATPITLSSDTAGSTITYSVYRNSFTSTDGTLVGTANQTYTAPITLDASYFPVRIAAKATLQNYVDSASESFSYTAKKATGGEKNYYGSLHAHTMNSDGQGTLPEAYAYARDQGKFDFFIVTDHSNSYDSATYDVTKDQNINNYNTTNAPWLAGKKAAIDAATPTYITDYGYEMTWSGGPGHMNTFNTTGFVSRNNATLNNKTNDGGLQTYYQMLQSTPGSISQLNHPGATFGNFADFGYHNNAIDDKVTLVEAGNGEGAIGSGGYFRSVDQFILALDKGWHVAPTNNGDNHKKGWGTSNTAGTVVYTNDFTLSGIYTALHDRSVWSTENRDLDVTYHLSDGTNTYSMGAILNAPPATANITVTAANKNPGVATSNIASVKLISYGGKIVDQQTYSGGSSNVNYTYSMTAPAAGYYFAIITDNQGFVAVTAPIWLGSAPKVGITSVTNSSVMPVTTEALNVTTNFFNNESTPVTLKSISYTVDGDSAANKSYTPGTSIAPSGVAKHEFSYTPTTPGTKTVTISAVLTVGGVDKTYTGTKTMKVVDINSVSYVGLDASHGNEYVSGGSYPDTMANMMTLAGANSVRVVQLKTSAEFIAATSNPKYKMIILNAPSRKSVTAWPTPANYTPAEIEALKAFSENGNTLVFGNIADFGESTNTDPSSPKKHMSELQNDVLTAIGSTLRESDDEVMDDDKNGGQPYRLYPTEFNMANPLLQGVVDGQTYSQYSGSTIYAVDPATGERTSTLPTTVSPLVFGFPTTYSAETDNDNFGYGTTKATFPYITVGTNKTDKGMSNSQGLYIPKYANPNSKIATSPEEKMLAASETVTHPNGKTSLVVVAGGSFMSNFEIQVTLDNAGTLPYANYNLMDNLYKIVNPKTITSVANAKNLPDGTEVIIEATATSEVNTQSTDPDTNKGFFDSIYAQDATGGINLFPVASGIQEGQKARFEGTITHYQGEVELTVSKMTVLDPSIQKLAPTTLTTAGSMSSANTGNLVKTQGVVSNIYKDTDGTINQFTINDGSGPAIVFINGYITKGTALPFVTDGANVSVVGLASIGEVSSDSDMHPRIRVRDRSEILKVTLTNPSNPSSSSGGGSAPSGTLISSSNGGTVKDNGVTIVIPAGAANTDFRVTVEKVANTDEMLKGTSGKLISDVFEIKKDLTGNFTANLTISLPFDLTKVDLTKSDVAVYWYDETAKKWIALSNPSVDKDKSTVSGIVNHFTKFAVIATDKKPTDPTNTGSTGKGTLSDIAGHWAEANIRELIQAGAIEGYPNGTFGPDRTITRAEFASILVKAFKLQEKSGKGFADTNNHWARKAIETAAAYDIISGYSDSSFGPDDQITREQMAVMIVRAAKLPAAAAGNSFTDRTAISEWAQSAVASASASHVIDGYSDGSFKAQANATRAEAVTVILKALKK